MILRTCPIRLGATIDCAAMASIRLCKTSNSKPANTAAFDFSKPLSAQALDKCAIVFILPAQRFSAVTVTTLIENLKDDPKILANKLEQRLKGNKVHVSSIERAAMTENAVIEQLPLEKIGPRLIEKLS